MSKEERRDKLLIPIDRAGWKSDGAYLWDAVIHDVKGWGHMKYRWIASSIYGDQIIMTESSPLHPGVAIYLHGPDVAGPRSGNQFWIENILYLGSSYDEWRRRIGEYGDEHSIAPGGIDRELGDRAGEYKSIYRNLNPGLEW